MPCKHGKTHSCLVAQLASGEWLHCVLARFVGWSGGRKRVRQNSVSKQQPGGFECAVNVAGKLVVAVVAAAHGFSVLLLGTRGPF